MIRKTSINNEIMKKTFISNMKKNTILPDKSINNKTK